VLLCRRLDLYGCELLAVDGTRIKAANSKDRNFTRSSLRAFIRAADERLEDYLKRSTRAMSRRATSGGARTKNLAQKIAALGEKRSRYPSDAGATRANLRGPDLADRSRQPRPGKRARKRARRLYGRPSHVHAPRRRHEVRRRRLPDRGKAIRNAFALRAERACSQAQRGADRA
jgi:hypothetical protein